MDAEYGKLFVVLMGMGTVFFGLICIIVLTTIMGKVMGNGNAAPASAAAPAARPAAAAPAVDMRKQEELVAVITAAICEDLGPGAADITITSIKRV